MLDMLSIGRAVGKGMGSMVGIIQCKASGYNPNPALGYPVYTPRGALHSFVLQPIL